LAYFRGGWGSNDTICFRIYAELFVLLCSLDTTEIPAWSCWSCLQGWVHFLSLVLLYGVWEGAGHTAVSVSLSLPSGLVSAIGPPVWSLLVWIEVMRGTFLGSPELLCGKRRRMGLWDRRCFLGPAYQITWCFLINTSTTEGQKHLPGLPSAADGRGGESGNIEHGSPCNLESGHGLAGFLLLGLSQSCIQDVAWLILKTDQGKIYFQAHSYGC
jgi:hypothetical protein